MSFEADGAYPVQGERPVERHFADESAETWAKSDTIDVEVINEWLPTDPARSIEAILIVLFVISGFGLAAWVVASFG